MESPDKWSEKRNRFANRTKRVEPKLKRKKNTISRHLCSIRWWKKQTKCLKIAKWNRREHKKTQRKKKDKQQAIKTKHIIKSIWSNWSGYRILNILITEPMNVVAVVLVAGMRWRNSDKNYCWHIQYSKCTVNGSEQISYTLYDRQVACE